MRAIRWAVLGGILMLAAGCGDYRYVYRNANGGTIALKGDRDSAMEKARSAMKSHCRGPYTITEEGEVIIGQDTVAGSETGVTRRNTVVTQEGSSTRQATEWRVTYQCGYAAPAPAPAPTGPPPGAYPPSGPPAGGPGY